MSRVAFAPAGLRWEPTYTVGFVAIDIPADRMRQLRADYRQIRQTGTGPGASRHLAIARAGIGLHPRTFHPNRRRAPWLTTP